MNPLSASKEKEKNDSLWLRIMNLTLGTSFLYQGISDVIKSIAMFSRPMDMRTCIGTCKLKLHHSISTCSHNCLAIIMCT